MAAGPEGMHRQSRPIGEEPAQAFTLVGIECGKPWQGGAGVSIERRRNPPDAARTGGPLLQLVEVVFLDPVRRIGNDAMNRVFEETTEPLQAVGVDDPGPSNGSGLVIECQPSRFSIFSCPTV